MAPVNGIKVGNGSGRGFYAVSLVVGNGDLATLGIGCFPEITYSVILVLDFLVKGVSYRFNPVVQVVSRGRGIPLRIVLGHHVTDQVIAQGLYIAASGQGLQSIGIVIGKCGRAGVNDN